MCWFKSKDLIGWCFLRDKLSDLLKRIYMLYMETVISFSYIFNLVVIFCKGVTLTLYCQMQNLSGKTCNNSLKTFDINYCKFEFVNIHADS